MLFDERIGMSTMVFVKIKFEACDCSIKDKEHINLYVKFGTVVREMVIGGVIK